MRGGRQRSTGKRGSMGAARNRCRVDHPHVAVPLPRQLAHAEHLADADRPEPTPYGSSALAGLIAAAAPIVNGEVRRMSEATKRRLRS